MTDKPENVSDNPHMLPYASNVGAPMIKPEQLGGWKHAAASRANKHFKDRFDNIKQQYEQLTREYQCNEMLYHAEMKFKPVIGRVYYLYSRTNGEHYVSLFEPHERACGDAFVGEFKLNYDNRWEQVNI